jgi:hypothetical protein
MHPQALALVQHRSAAAMSWVDGRGLPADLRQPPHPTTLAVGDANVDVSGAKLPQPFLLHRIGQREN